MGKLAHKPTSMNCITGQSHSGTVIIVDFADAYFHIPNALVNPAATASDLCTIGKMARPGAINMVQVHIFSRVRSLKLGMTYDHTHSKTSVLQSTASPRAERIESEFRAEQDL